MVLGPMSEHPLDKLFATIAARKAAGDTAQSYTAKLLSQGVEKCAKKFGEEAVELPATDSPPRSSHSDLPPFFHRWPVSREGSPHRVGLSVEFLQPC